MFMIVIGVIGISLSSILVRFSDAPSLVTAAYRLFWTVLLMTPPVFIRPAFRRELFSRDRATAALCALSGVFLSVHFVLWFESLRYTSVTSSTVFVCTEAIWVALGYCLFMGGSVSRRETVCIAVSFLGSVLVAFSDLGSQEGHLNGDLMALTAAAAAAAYTLIGRTVRKTVSTTVYTYLVYVFCSLSLAAAALLTQTPLSGYGSRTVLYGLALSVCSTLLGHSMFSFCLKYMSPAFVSSAKLCEPAVASLFAAVLFGEIPAPLQALGGLLILAGILAFPHS